MNNFRKNLRDELTYQALTVKDLSEKTGIPKSSLDGYLAHKPTMPTIEVAVKIARALHCSIEYLMRDNEEFAQKFTLRQQEIQKLNQSLSILPNDKFYLARTLIHSLTHYENKNN